MSQCWSTINRGTDLLAFHSNLLSSIFAPLTREILNFLKMERDLGIRVLWRVGRYATRSYCIINSNLLTSFQPWNRIKYDGDQSDYYFTLNLEPGNWNNPTLGRDEDI